jgi:DNA 3'-phosphatase
MWKDADSVIYYIPTDFKFNKALAVFNFIDTLVILKKNFTNITLKYKYDEIKSKLREITEKGASIMIYQCFYKNDIDHVKELFELLIKDLEIPIVAFFSTVRNRYSKPFTHMWKLIELFYSKEKKIIYKNLSIVVGHKAGRINIYNSKKIDNNCLDRAFAINNNLTFFTPERFFLNDNKISLWQFNTDVINQQSRKAELENNKLIQVPVIMDELSILPNSDLYTIIITGPPSCGKTTLAKKIKKKWDIEYKMGPIGCLSENNFETFEELQTSVNYQLKEKNSIIVDLMCNICNITNIIKTSMLNKVPILVVEIKVSEKVVKLLDFIKIQNSTSYKSQIYLKYQWATYYKKYKEPRYSELPCVKYVAFPLIIQLSDEFWYEYSY